MSWPTPAVKGVVVDRERRVLLCREGEGWRLPGAKFAGGKTWLDSIAAALRADTGLEAESYSLVGLYTSEPESRVVASFLVTEFRGETSAQWFAGDALPPALDARDRARIEDALGFSGEVVQR